MSATTVAAVDLGATSGRVLLARIGRDTLETEVVHRFANSPVRTSDGLHWDVLNLYRESREGLREAATQEPELTSFGIDAWACDYALLRDGRLLGEPYHYRDARTSGGVAGVHAQVPHRELFGRSGIQFLTINTVYQLMADRSSGVLGLADGMLLLPDLFTYWLTGTSAAERTNASTTALVDIRTGEWDLELAERLGYQPTLFPSLIAPGTVTGSLAPDVAAEIGIGTLQNVAVGSHDTASAVVAIPMAASRAAYVSCGTWSLVGVEVETPIVTDAALAANFTNESGVDGRTRFLRNVMGLWVLSRALEEWERRGERVDLPTLLGAAAEYRGPVCVFDIDDERFFASGDMLGRIDAWCVENDVPPPTGIVESVRAIVESLAVALARAVRDAAVLSSVPVETVHVVGGGARNSLLCSLLADQLGVTVVAGPVEATAIGNALVQARTVRGSGESLESLRELVRSNTTLRVHEPRPVRDGAAPESFLG